MSTQSRHMLFSLLVSLLCLACGSAQGGAGGIGASGGGRDIPSAEELASHYMGQAGMALSEGDEQGALDYYLEAAKIYDDSGQVSIERAEAHFLAADLAYRLGERRQAVEEYDAAVQIYVRFKGNSKIKAANALNNMGTIYKELERKDQARECWEKALQIYKEAPDEYKSNRNMAKIEQNLRDLAEGY